MMCGSLGRLRSDELTGVRQYHFPIYYDPTGTNYTANAGLKIANQSANVSAQDPKWGYPGKILTTFLLYVIKFCISFLQQIMHMYQF